MNQGVGGNDLHESPHKVLFRDQTGFLSAITSVARMGFFSTDRVISEYADSIWNIEPLEIRDD